MIWFRESDRLVTERTVGLSVTQTTGATAALPCTATFKL